jgi:hypothetical protein
MMTVYFEGGVTYEMNDELIAKLGEDHPTLDVSVEVQKLQRFIYQKAITPQRPRDFVRSWFDKAIAKLAERQAAQMDSKPVKSAVQKDRERLERIYVQSHNANPNDPESLSALMELYETGDARNYAEAEEKHSRIGQLAAKFHASRGMNDAV